ncbi:hypothetical protein SNE40_003859 [Patella caerulea]|uniref:LYR motif-containing protein 9 n=1 Tax=Patella caerulea TaxID=87958 RepID=A0AAN8K3T6_PATCE
MKVDNPIQLYRFILRSIKVLPKEARIYYTHQTRQSYKSHCDETDTERIKQIIERAVEDTKWVVRKYTS